MRCGRDSNPRTEVLQTSPLDHSGTAPFFKKQKHCQRTKLLHSYFNLINMKVKGKDNKVLEYGQLNVKKILYQNLWMSG